MGSVDVLTSIVKMLSALAVVLGLMIAAAWVMRRVLQRTGTGGAADEGMIRIVSSRYLGPKSSILVMDILDRIVVVGLSGGRMTLLATISDPEAVGRVRSVNKDRHSFPMAEQLLAYGTKWASIRRSGKDGGKHGSSVPKS